MNAKKFIQDKLDIIENEPEHIKTIASILVNAENDLTEEDINDFKHRFHTSAMIKEWNEYARTTYIRMQISKNHDFASVAMLNSTIFVHNFIEKFLHSTQKN